MTPAARARARILRPRSRRSLEPVSESLVCPSPCHDLGLSDQRRTYLLSIWRSEVFAPCCPHGQQLIGTGEHEAHEPDRSCATRAEVDVRIYELLLEAWGELSGNETLIGRRTCARICGRGTWTRCASRGGESCAGTTAFRFRSEEHAEDDCSRSASGDPVDGRFRGLQDASVAERGALEANRRPGRGRNAEAGARRAGPRSSRGGFLGPATSALIHPSRPTQA